MAIDWIWSSKDSAGVEPAIREQLVNITDLTLRLRNPRIVDSAFMGKIYSSILIGGAIAAIFYFSGRTKIDYGLLISTTSILIFIFLMLTIRVKIIKNQSDFLFDRSSRTVFYKEHGRIVSGAWDSVVGGLQSKSEFTGRGISVTHSLILRMQAESINVGAKASMPVSLFVEIESNESSDPHVLYVGQIWEFIRLFMDTGRGKLPEPVGANWWYVPHHRICLTPVEAWRHYAPWRTGEPDEIQGKKNWLLPLWLSFFPYNMFCALCWYSVCRVFNVRSAPPPNGLG